MYVRYVICKVLFMLYVYIILLYNYLFVYDMRIYICTYKNYYIYLAYLNLIFFGIYIICSLNN